MLLETFTYKKLCGQHGFTAQRIALLFGLMVCQPALSTDLFSAYQDALAYDAQYTAARANRAAGIEKLPQARAGLLPTLQASANSQMNEQDSLQRLNNARPLNARYNSNGWNVQFSQPLLL